MRHHVPVIVDQPGHPRAPAAVDHDGIRRMIAHDRRRRDALDFVAADEDVRRPRERATRAVEDANVLEKCRSGRLCLRSERGRDRE